MRKLRAVGRDVKIVRIAPNPLNHRSAHTLFGGTDLGHRSGFLVHVPLGDDRGVGVDQNLDVLEHVLARPDLLQQLLRVNE